MHRVGRSPRDARESFLPAVSLHPGRPVPELVFVRALLGLLVGWLVGRWGALFLMRFDDCRFPVLPLSRSYCRRGVHTIHPTAVVGNTKREECLDRNEEPSPPL